MPATQGIDGAVSNTASGILRNDGNFRTQVFAKFTRASAGTRRIVRRDMDFIISIVTGAGALMPGFGRMRHLSARHCRRIKKQNSQKTTEIEFTATARGAGSDLCHAGRIYRSQTYRDGEMRRKCIDAGRNLKWIGYAGGRAGKFRPPSPSEHGGANRTANQAPTKGVATNPRAVITTDGGSAGVTPVREVSDRLGEQEIQLRGRPRPPHS